MLAEPTWRVHVSTWLRFFIGNRLGPYHAMPQHVINGLLNLADGRKRHTPAHAPPPAVQSANCAGLASLCCPCVSVCGGSVERGRAVRYGMRRRPTAHRSSQAATRETGSRHRAQSPSRPARAAERQRLHLLVRPASHHRTVRPARRRSLSRHRARHRHHAVSLTSRQPAATAAIVQSAVETAQVSSGVVLLRYGRMDAGEAKQSEWYSFVPVHSSVYRSSVDERQDEERSWIKC